MLGTKFFKMELKSNEIQSLKTHRFVGTDNSILSKYVLGHYTDWLIKKIPRNIAPNLLTLCGFTAMMLSLFLTLAIDPRLNDAPRYLSGANLLLMFIYFTCDNLDGAQARRTGSGSPLGQLLDHGVDSCCALVTSIALSSSLGFGLSQDFIVLMLAIMLQFYIAGLEEKFTGCFVLGSISGASEGICLVLVLHLLSFVCGRTLFQKLLSDEFLWPVKRICSVVLAEERLQMVSVMIATVSIVNVVSSLISIRSKVHPSRSHSFYLTFIGVLLLAASFVMLHNTLRMESLGLQYMNILTFGQIFSIKYINVMYSYITKSNPLMFMPSYLVYLSVSIILQLQAARMYATLLLSIAFVLSSSYYLASVLRIVLAFTEVLEIRFLSIGEPKRAQNTSKTH